MEAIAIEDMLKKIEQPPNWDALVHAVHLVTINAAIWDRINTMQGHSQLPGGAKAELGVQLFELNRTRSDLVFGFDSIFGKERREKL